MAASQSWRGATLLCCALLAASAHADDSAHSPYVSASGTGDEDGNSTLDFEAALPIGRYVWLFGGGGHESTSNSTDDVNAGVWRAGAGIGDEHVQLTAGYVRRKDGGFKQGDSFVALDWLGSRGSIGVDYFNRKADAETVASMERRRRAPRSVRIVESLDGDGYGVHGDLDATENCNVFASGMKYDYKDVDTNHPFLSRRLFLGGSGVTRESAFLDQSVTVGATYRFSATSLTFQYIRDEALETHDVTDTGELSLVVLLGDHWSITPSVGYSDSDASSDAGSDARSDADGGIAYGGLSIGYNW